MKRLILSSIPADFDPKRDVLLGPWCILGKEHMYPDWETFDIEPDPFPNIQMLTEADLLTCKYANSLIAPLSHKLNNINGVNHSYNFWRLMLLPWLILLVQSTWERQCRIKNCIEKYRNIDLTIQVLNKENHFEFENTLDFLHNGILNPIYNCWIFSKLIENVKSDRWELFCEKDPIEYEANYYQGKSRHLLLRKVNEIIFGNLRCKGVYGIGRINQIFWSLFLSIIPVRENREICNICSENEKIDLEWCIDIETFVWRMMPRCFKNLKNIKKSKQKSKKGRRRLLGPNIYWDEIEKCRLGLCLENGEKLILTQHGSNYGTAKVYPFPSQMEYRHHAFFSWGWREQEDYCGNFYDLPSPYLTKFQNKHKERERSIILVGMGARVITFRLDSFPMPMDQISYRKRKLEFLKNISTEIFKNLYYRPSQDNHPSLNDKSHFRNIFPQIKICDGKLHPQILKCRLLILDHPGTTLNIAMAANIPMICFWDKQQWAFCRQATPYFEALEKVGILYHCGVKAANKVNEIWDNVQDWWNQKAIQDARKDWCYQYARTSKLWWWEWTKALWKM